MGAAGTRATPSTSRHRARARRLPPTQCSATWFQGQEICGRDKPIEEPVCTLCAQAITRAQSGTAWFQLWIMEFIGEQARRAALADARSRRAHAEQQRKANSPNIEVVYYLRTGNRQVKIGTTGDLPRRLREYHRGSTLLAVEPGGHDLEQQRHNELRRWRVNSRREDYAEGPEVRARIDAVRAEHGDPNTFLDRSPESEVG